MNNQRYICTGPPGAGKTSVLEALSFRFDVIAEPARRVLARQRAIGGTGTGDQDQALFVSLMLQTALNDMKKLEGRESAVLFDRGLPDLLAFANYYELPTDEISRALDEHRYAETVFWCPPWEAIYVNDDERTLDFQGAAAFGELVRSAYTSSGYSLVDLPLVSIAERASIISEFIG